MAEPTWLSYADAAKLSDIADEVMDGIDADEAWAGAVDAAAEWVEDKRPDVTYTSPATAGARLRLGCARLAQRWHARRTSPMGQAGFSDFPAGILREDPDIAKLLGIGRKGRFVFGASRPIPEVTP
jgi:hypothetical protein